MATKELKNPTPIERAYKRISRDLKEKQFPPGTRLQPIRKLAQSYDISYLVAQRAIKKLQEDGIVEARPGDGIYTTVEQPHIDPAQAAVAANGNGAKTNKNRKTYSIGVVMPYWVSQHGGSAIQALVKGVLAHADSNRWRVELIYNSGHEACETAFADKITQKNVDGVVWLQPVPEHQTNLMRLIDRSIDVVATGRRFPFIPLQAITEDYDDLAEKVIQLCVDQGNTNIVLLTSTYQGRHLDGYSLALVEAFRAALSRRNMELPDEKIFQSEYTPMLHDFVSLFLQKHPQTNAIICAQSRMLEGVEQLEKANFWAHPERISLIGLAAQYNTAATHIGSIPLRRVIHPLEDIGRAAIRIFEEKWLGRPAGPEPNLTVEIS